MAQYNVSSSMSDRINLREAAESEAVEAADAIYAAGIHELTAEEAWQHADAAFDVAWSQSEEREDGPFADDRDEARGWYVQPFADALSKRLAALRELDAETAEA